MCLQRSPCVLIDRNTPAKCLEDPKLFEQLPEKCLATFFSYMECKRGAIDMRKRFRGNGAPSTGKFDAELQNLSSGNYNPEREILLLEKDTGEVYGSKGK